MASGLVLSSILVACANGGTQGGLDITDEAPSTTHQGDDAGASAVIPDDTDDDTSDDGAGSDSGAAKSDSGVAKGDAGDDPGTVDPKNDAGSDAGSPTTITGLGQVCSSTKPCPTDLSCVDGACRPSCTTPGTACSGAGLGVCFESTSPKGNYCMLDCDLADPSAACVTNACVMFTEGTDCVTAGTGEEFDLCTTTLDCEAGYQCALYEDEDWGSWHECEKWCVLGKSGECASSSCVDVYGTSAPTNGAGAKLGLCQ